MRRFRLLFLLFTAVLLAPLLLLVRHALHSVEVERAQRHQAVAERVFDEMERSLSAFLEPEEQRPFEAYVGTAAGDPSSPIVGHFQVDPDGTIRTSQNPRRADLGEIVARFWRGDRADQRATANTPGQRPGSTVALGASLARPPEPAAAATASKEGAAASAYDALRGLNKAASERLLRQRNADEFDSEARNTAPAGLRDQVAAAKPESKDAPTVQPPSVHEPQAQPPMSGQLVDPNKLLLYRTLVRGTQGYRQGFVVDVDRLCRWLRQQTLGSGEIGNYASFTCSSQAAAANAGGAQYAYQHRFADPFDALAARLELRPLPGLGSGTEVYTLSALLLGTTLLGLVAIYRMVSVVLRYSEQRSNFVAAVSHELKTPLTAIRMYGEMLRDGLVPSEAKRNEYYRHITGESERLTRLIGNVLEFSRLEKGNRHMALTKGSPAAVVHEAAELLRPHLQAEGFVLEVDVAADLPAVAYEHDALVQVLSNLVDNAVKYAREGSDKRIELSCGSDNRQVRITVRDHGPGVPARHLKRIFEPFYRGENELTRRSKGTGLGLALVRNLVERMGAEVSARNGEDGGLVVEVSWRI